MQIFYERVKETRKSKNISGTAMAAKIGILKQNYYRYEKGTREPSISTAVKIANALDVSLDYLAGISDTPEINAPSKKNAGK